MKDMASLKTAFIAVSKLALENPIGFEEFSDAVHACSMIVEVDELYE